MRALVVTSLLVFTAGCGRGREQAAEAAQALSGQWREEAIQCGRGLAQAPEAAPAASPGRPALLIAPILIAPFPEALPARPQTRLRGALGVLADVRQLAELVCCPFAEREPPVWFGEGPWPKGDAACQARAKEIIGRWIPVGTPVETAKALLEKEGLKCSFVDGERLLWERDDPRFACCSLKTQVVVYYAAGKVTAVEVYCIFLSL